MKNTLHLAVVLTLIATGLASAADGDAELRPPNILLCAERSEALLVV